jgi:putative DNA primase/helicase
MPAYENAGGASKAGGADAGAAWAGLTALQAAFSYVRSGLSVIPIRLDGSKRPAVAEWTTYQRRLPTPAELRSWFDRPRPFGPGVVCGRVSDNLELLDFDHNAAAVFPEWRELVEAECPGLVARLCVVRTPRVATGFHVRYRCRRATIPGNLKLAEEPYTDPATAKPKRRVLIETRGQGGQALAPGCPPECHPDGGLYLVHSGPDLTDLPDISPEEREVLLRAARSFDRVPAGEAAAPARPGASTPRCDGVLLPGDQFNASGPDWADLLEPHGWRCVHRRGDVRFWRRRGKDGPGWSATTGYCSSEKGGDLLCVFSTNAYPFLGPGGDRRCSAHSKFAAVALLEHRGDFRAAAAALYTLGFGERRQPRHGRRRRTLVVSLCTEIG